eukprot:4760748-Prymnesium_polylepis.1
MAANGWCATGGSRIVVMKSFAASTSNASTGEGRHPCVCVGGGRVSSGSQTDLRSQPKESVRFSN